VVKFQRRVSKKRYLNSKRVYKYERISFDIPKRYHRLINDYTITKKTARNFKLPERFEPTIQTKAYIVGTIRSRSVGLEPVWVLVPAG
jgi:hypothetical protein